MKKIRLDIFDLIDFSSASKIFVFLLLITFCICLKPLAAAAASIAVEYTSDASHKVLPGMIVVSDGKHIVRPAKQTEGKQAFGVGVALSKDALSVGKVGITSSGVATILVSDLGGVIATGDRIGVSPIEGVGMKAQSQSWVVGIAQASSASASPSITSEEVRTTDGKMAVASIKKIPVLLTISYYNDSPKGVLGGPIQKALDSAAGHSVPTNRVLIAIFTVSVAVIALIVMVNGAIKSSIISIGRNPLAYGMISNSLMKVLLTVVLVVAVTPILIYFIIK